MDEQDVLHFGPHPKHSLALRGEKISAYLVEKCAYLVEKCANLVEKGL